MPDIILILIGGIVIGACTTRLYDRHGWRIWLWARLNWPTRCTQCGVWHRRAYIESAKTTTGAWVALCEPCYDTHFRPLTSAKQP